MIISKHISYSQVNDKFVYTAPSGVSVTSCQAPEDDFKTVIHYMRWSYGAWISKIVKALRTPQKV